MLCIALGRQQKIGSPGTLRTPRLFLCRLSCFPTIVSFGTWQGRFSSEGNALTLTDKVAKQRWDFYYKCSSKVKGILLLFSFRRWCVNYHSFRAPIVYVLTMYVCFMKLFNLQFTFFKKSNHHSNGHHKVLCWL